MAGAKNSRASSERFARRRWSWVQFWCAFAVAAVGSFLRIDAAFQSLPAHLLKSFVVALAVACLAGRYGDPVWLWMACLVSC
jgi:hypothetical protein